MWICPVCIFCNQLINVFSHNSPFRTVQLQHINQTRRPLNCAIEPQQPDPKCTRCSSTSTSCTALRQPDNARARLHLKSLIPASFARLHDRIHTDRTNYRSNESNTIIQMLKSHSNAYVTCQLKWTSLSAMCIKSKAFNSPHNALSHLTHRTSHKNPHLYHHSHHHLHVLPHSQNQTNNSTWMMDRTSC